MTLSLMRRLAWLLLLAAAPVWGAPVVTGPGSTPTITEGTPITVTGSGFGSGGPPIKWDNFDSCTNGAGVDGRTAIVGGTWSTQLSGGLGQGALIPITCSTTDQRVGSTASAKCVFPNGEAQYGCSLTQGFSMPNVGDTIYVSWLVRYIPNAANSWPRQWKPVSIIGNGGNDIPLMYSGANGLVASPTTAFNVHFADPNGDEVHQPEASLGPISFGTVRNGCLASPTAYYRFELWMKQSTENVNDGAYDYWLYDGDFYDYSAIGIASVADNTVQTRQGTDGGDFSGIRIGYYNSTSSPSTPGNSATVWLDDVYIAYKRSRVEICNSATWAARTRCEIQPVTTWADGSVTVTVNQGALAGSAWLYVVDESGVPSDRATGGTANPADGLPVTFDTGGGVTAACNDTLDNDGDGDTDGADSACIAHGASHNEEADCGDGKVSSHVGEECEGDAAGDPLNNKTCETLGYDYGLLTGLDCDETTCQYIETNCHYLCEPVTGVTMTATADSASTCFPAANAVDSDAGSGDSIWHTEYLNSGDICAAAVQPNNPHRIDVDLGSGKTVCGFFYRQRHDGGVNGNYREWEIYTCPAGGDCGANGADWGNPDDSGQFTFTPGDVTWGETFIPVANTRYVRFLSRSSYQASAPVGDGKWGSAADFIPRTVNTVNPQPCTVLSVASALTDEAVASFDLSPSCGSAATVVLADAADASGTNVEQDVAETLSGTYGGTAELAAFSCATPLFVLAKASGGSYGPGVAVTACTAKGTGTRRIIGG